MWRFLKIQKLKPGEIIFKKVMKKERKQLKKCKRSRLVMIRDLTIVIVNDD